MLLMYVYMYVCECIYIYIYMYVSMYVCIIHIEEILMLPLSLSLVCMYCVYTSVMLVRITVVFVVSRMWIMLLCLGWTWSVRLSPCRRKSTS